jgi:hypothetical protein
MLTDLFALVVATGLLIAIVLTLPNFGLRPVLNKND